MRRFNRPTSRLPRSRSGFTLLEVLATLVLIGIVLPAVMAGISAGTGAASEAKHKVEAVTLAQAKLAELQVNSQYQTAGGSGDFGSDYPGYQWTSSIQLTDLNLSVISVRVTWFARGRERFVDLSTMVYQAGTATESSATGATGIGTGTGTTGTGSRTR